MSLQKVVGIDLGTTYSAVAAFDKDDDEAKIIVNREDGDTATTPSVVSLDPVTHKAIVGWAAKRAIARDPNNTVIEIKREMGEEFTPRLIAKFGAEGVPGIGESGKPVKVHFAGEWLLPQEISAFTLMRMKEVAEAEIGSPILDAVITVPAYFTEKQKKATKEAALLAGLYPRQLIPEPTAAAICYGVDQQEEETRVYLVYDLGGGTFDVSIIQVKASDIRVIATSGDPRLGGGDFDDAITTWAVARLQQDYQLDVSNDPAAKARIKLKAEQTKINLASRAEATLDLIELDPAKSPVLTLKREVMEELIEPMLRKSLTYVDRAIASATDRKRDDINAILLVGGSTKMPCVKRLLLEYFGKDDSFVRAGLDPDAVVARGAAILAKRFAPSSPPFDVARNPDSSLINPDMEDDLNISLITEHSLGVGVQEDRFSRIVRQGENIPISRTESNYTNPGPTSTVQVHVFQGPAEAKYIHECTEIGQLELGPMEPKPEGFHKFSVTFTLDENGLLSTTVKHLNENKEYEGKFDQKTGVGGLKKLAVLHEKLRAMYGGAVIEVGEDAVTRLRDELPPPPVAPDTPPASSGGRAAIPGEPGRPGVGSEAVTPPSSETTGAAAGGESPPPGDAGPQMVMPTRQVPEKYQSIRRRAAKQLEREVTVSLLESYNRFIQAVNAGADDGALDDAVDELEDAYHDARRATS